MPAARIIKDKLFVFGGYEHLDRGLPQPDTISSANAALIGLLPSQLAVAPSIQHAQFLNLRTDWVVDSKNQVFLRYNYFRNEYPFNAGVGGTNALDAAADFHDRSHLAAAQVLTTLSPTMLNELRFGWPYRNERHLADPLTGPGPQIAISGIASFNGSTSVGDRFQEKIPNLNDAFTMIRGSHTLKFGAGFQQILDTQTNDVYNQYVFPSVAAYLQAESGANPFSYTTYNSVIGLPGAWYHSFFWNWFAQDSWQIRPGLLVIAGVRYDRFQSPDANPNASFVYSRSFRNPGKDFAPRLGLAWNITPKTVIRASSGLFFEPSPTNLWYNALVTSNPLAYQASIQSNSPFRSGVSERHRLSAGRCAAVLLGHHRGHAQLQERLHHRFQLPDCPPAYEQRFSDGGIRQHGGRDLEFLRNMNLINPISYLADGRPVFGPASPSTRLFPQFNNIVLQDVGAITDYNALVVNYQHRWSYGYQVSASYTWSHSISDAPDANSFEQNNVIEDPTDRARDRGNSSVNRPQALTLTSVILPKFTLGNRVANWLANNNQLALLANLSSGDEQNIVANRVLNGDAKAGSGSTSGSGASTAATRPLLHRAQHASRAEYLPGGCPLYPHVLHAMGAPEAELHRRGQ